MTPRATARPGAAEGPLTIRGYLAALNAALEVGLRSRRRILAEVFDHLSLAADEQLARGASRDEAQRRAITAFGSPEDTAARFQAGLIGRLDRRLALGARWLYRRTARRPSGVAAVCLALGVVVAGAVAAVGTLLGASNPLAAAVNILAAGAFWALGYGALPWWRRRLRSGERDWKIESTFWCVFPAVYAYFTMVGQDARGWPVAGAVALIYATYFVADAGVSLAASRGCDAQLTDEECWQSWAAEHPWRAAVSWVAPLPLGLLALIALYPGPAMLRIALAMLVAAITALAASAVRLEQSRHEKEALQNTLQGAA